MINYATIEKFKEFRQVKYYTIRYEYSDGLIDEETETDKFLEKYLNVKQPSESAENIINIISTIGNRGAYKRYFRFENKAVALPPRNKFLKELDVGKIGEQNLRLYCVRLSDSVVVLLNGGEKTTQRVQDCQNVSGYFRAANKIASLLDEAIQDNEIKIGYKNLFFDEDYLLIM